jgi:Arc/MetJ-type ribon-helix-helix transcriptional regulator
MKTKRNHHSKNSARPHRVEIMYSDPEMELLDQRYKEVCNGTYVSRSEFIRKLSLEGEIKVAISQEVRLLLGKMNILGGNLWELRKQAHNEGMFNLEIKFKNLANQLEETIEELQSKIS